MSDNIDKFLEYAETMSTNSTKKREHFWDKSVGGLDNALIIIQMLKEAKVLIDSAYNQETDWFAVAEFREKWNAKLSDTQQSSEE